MKAKKMAIKNIESNAQITIYESEDGKARVEVRFEDENVWLTQKLMAELFEVAVPTINEHLSNIFSTRELSKKTVIRNFRITAADRKLYLAKHYSLAAIIAGIVCFFIQPVIQ